MMPRETPRNISRDAELAEEDHLCQMAEALSVNVAGSGAGVAEGIQHVAKLGVDEVP
jgi:hypothetical protein